MDEFMTPLIQAFSDYRQDIEKCQRKLRPTDGLLGFGHGLKDDACHERFDERIQQAVGELSASSLTPAQAESVLRTLLLRDDVETWPLAAQWMLVAIQRHALPLIPLLNQEQAAGLAVSYEKRWPRHTRLPAQRDILKALKKARQG